MGTENITPHGGTLVNRVLQGKAGEEASARAKKLTSLKLSEREVCDLEMIAVGAMSPLEGFMGQADYEACLEKMRLSSGVVWPLPVVKSVTADEKAKMENEKEVSLVDGSGNLLAVLEVKDIYSHDKKLHAEKVYGTSEEAHPGVAQINRMGEFFVGGAISLINRPHHKEFAEGRLDPAETRAYFQEKKWKHIVGFQTRNPIHRAHEFLTKCALETVDGLMVHPLMGETKSDDVPASVRWDCYKALIEKYYPKERVLLAVFPAAMRYAGPREAIWHAICRKNYGCTHFIVGRDHAGCMRPDKKPYYGSYDAQLIFDQFTEEEIGIEIYRFEHSFFDRKLGEMVSFKSKPEETDAFVVSGTKLREMLQNGEMPPKEITRPEVAKILIEAMREKAASK